MNPNSEKREDPRTMQTKAEIKATLLYFVTGQFTVVILVTFVVGCGLGEIARAVTKYNSFKGNTISFALFSLGMVGSPLPIWIMRDSFLAQIMEQGMPADYVPTPARWLCEQTYFQTFDVPPYSR